MRAHADGAHALRLRAGVIGAVTNGGADPSWCREYDRSHAATDRWASGAAADQGVGMRQTEGGHHGCATADICGWPRDRLPRPAGPGHHAVPRRPHHPHSHRAVAGECFRDLDHGHLQVGRGGRAYDE